MQPFGDHRLPILAPEHLLVCKVIFDRPKDWLDIEQVLVCVQEIDLVEIRASLRRTVGADDARVRRFEEITGTLLDDRSREAGATRSGRRQLRA